MSGEAGDFLDGWARLMAEQGTGGVWDREGGGACIEDVPVSGPVAARFERWLAWYERARDDWKRDPDFDYAGFAAEGLAIARAVKVELPDWTIVYFDASRCRYEQARQPREEFEYEVGADGSIPTAATRPIGPARVGDGA